MGGEQERGEVAEGLPKTEERRKGTRHHDLGLIGVGKRRWKKLDQVKKQTFATFHGGRKKAAASAHRRLEGGGDFLWKKKMTSGVLTSRTAIRKKRGWGEKKRRSQATSPCQRVRKKPPGKLRNAEGCQGGSRREGKRSGEAQSVLQTQKSMWGKKVRNCPKGIVSQKRGTTGGKAKKGQFVGNTIALNSMQE